METTTNKHTVVAWLEDKPGVLNRVVGLFRRRNFNIESLTVGHSETPGISRLTFVVDGDDRMVDQAIKQLYKLVNVTRVENLTDHPAIVRELVLVRVKVDAQTRAEIMQYRGYLLCPHRGREHGCGRRTGCWATKPD